MIEQTRDTHEGKPVFRHATGRCFAFLFTPAFIGNEQVGFLQEVCGNQPRPRVDFEQVGRLFPTLQETGGIRWTGD